VLFYAAYPALDKTPSEATRPAQTFVEANAVDIDAKCEVLWPSRDGKRWKPDHWSAMNLETRAKRLGL
jgi:hypothetical protein